MLIFFKLVLQLCTIKFDINVRFTGNGNLLWKNGGAAVERVG